MFSDLAPQSLTKCNINSFNQHKYEKKTSFYSLHFSLHIKVKFVILFLVIKKNLTIKSISHYNTNFCRFFFQDFFFLSPNANSNKFINHPNCSFLLIHKQFKAHHSHFLDSVVFDVLGPGSTSDHDENSRSWAFKPDKHKW